MIEDLTVTHTVTSYECGANSLMKPETLPLLCQEIAEQHASQHNFGYEWAMENHVFWAETRAELEFIRLPKWKEVVTLRTNTGMSGSVAARRFVEMTNAQGEVLAKADLQWVLADLKTRRLVPPRRLIASIAEMRTPYVAPAELPEFPSAPAATASLYVTQREIDFNGHVNNASYLIWALDTLPESLRPSGIPTRVSLRFRKETMLGEQVSVAHHIAGQATSHVISSGGVTRAEVTVLWA